jgi:hypothetical protein
LANAFAQAMQLSIDELCDTPNISRQCRTMNLESCFPIGWDVYIFGDAQRLGAEPDFFVPLSATGSFWLLFEPLSMQSRSVCVTELEISVPNAAAVRELPA